METVTYYVAIPFLQTEDGYAVGEAVECPNQNAAISRARQRYVLSWMT